MSHVCVSLMPLCACIRGDVPMSLDVWIPGLQAHTCIRGKGVSLCPHMGGENAARHVSVSRCPTVFPYFGIQASQLLTNALLQSADPGRALELSFLFAVLDRGASFQSDQSKESPGALRKAEGQGIGNWF